MRLEIDVYRDSFSPALYLMRGRYGSEQMARYYGHRWFVIIHLLFWELEITYTYGKSRISNLLATIRDFCWSAWLSLPPEDVEL